MKVRHVAIAATAIAAIALSGCATSPKVQVSQIGDASLRCHQLSDQLAGLDRAQAQVDSKKGVNGTNVAGALFWLPGLAYTYYDAGQATDKINERRSHLSEIFNQKKCDPAILKSGTVAGE